MLLNQAIELHKKGMLAEAEAIYRKIVSSESKNFDALHLLAIICSEKGKMTEAEQKFRLALSIDSNYPPAYHNFGLHFSRLKNYQSAVEQFSKALAISPNFAPVYSDRGSALAELGKIDQALSDHNKAVALAPNVPMAWHNRGMALLRKRDYASALKDFESAIRLNPAYAQPWVGCGDARKEQKRYDEALAAYDKALMLKPDFAEAWIGRGNVFNDLNRRDEALAAFDQALSRRPDLEGGWLGRGNVLAALKRHDEAFAAYDKALSLKPDMAEVWLGRGNIFTDIRRFDHAALAYDKALAIKPDLDAAWLGRGNSLTALKRHDEAFAAYDQALTLKPDLAEGWLGRGNVLAALNSRDEAMAAYDKARSLNADLAEAWLGRGNIFIDLNRHDEALVAYDKALSLKPDSAEAWLGRAEVLGSLRRFDQAALAYDKGLAFKPHLIAGKGARLHSKMQICDWSNWEAEGAELISSVRSGHPDTLPFPLLAIASTLADQLQCARLWVTDTGPPAGASIRTSPRYGHDRIRVAYLSADFRNHPVAQAVAELLERHDRSRFEIIGLSIGPDDGSDARARLIRALNQFHDIRTKSDAEAARLIGELNVDIVVKVAPHTEGSRLGILAHRPAPIQVNGFSAWTSGADFLDYVLADPRTLSFDEQPWFSEQIVHVPDSYFPHDSTQQIAANAPSRAEAGLPQNAFVFCSFNASYKINPRIFDIWMRLLKRIAGSVLWLTHVNEQAIGNLRREAASRDVDPSRLVFAPRMPLLSDHLARHRLADLFLDTLPFGAHTTAKDALWGGLPVLTCRGDTFVGRIAASQLHAVGLADLVTDSLDEYEAAALRLAQNADELQTLRGRLAANKLTHPLFDTARLCRHFEAAYTEMWQRHARGEPPKSFAVGRQ